MAGLIAGYTYNRFKDTKLPEYLGFFSGRRLVPIVTALPFYKWRSGRDSNPRPPA
ncbi:PTS transporter subunit EIIC [Streptomyces sp. NPDC056734]|uniref:PTS transporter subunit EIIC n=1 Tax=Streptomyces sp. NPDC056734 TaxID=3345931 RepID=UPI0036BF7C81